MKKLISLKDVEKLHSENQTGVYIDENTIVTPAAKDYVKLHKMNFVERKEECCKMEKFDMSGFTTEDLYKILKVVVDRGLLNAEPPKYESESLCNGFKIVRGNSLKYDPLFPEVTGDKAKFLEVVHEADSPMQSGYFTIDRTSFDTTTEVYETYCIMEGCLDIKVNGTGFRAVRGDVLTIPKGSHIELSSEGFVKIFYSCGDR